MWLCNSFGKNIRYQRFIWLLVKKQLLYYLWIHIPVHHFPYVPPHAHKLGIYYNRYWCLYSTFYHYRSIKMYFLFVERDWIHLLELSSKGYFKTIGSLQTSYSNFYYSWNHKLQKQGHSHWPLIPLDINSVFYNELPFCQKGRSIIKQGQIPQFA